MTAEIDPRDLVRTIVREDHRPVTDSLKIVREKRVGRDAVFAVTLEDRDGVEWRGVLGLRQHRGTWQPSGSFMGSTRVTGTRAAWTIWGGWGPGDQHEAAALGGWAADPAAVSARLVDIAGNTLDDTIENRVFLFLWNGGFDPRGARLELLDANGRVTRIVTLCRER